MRRLIRYSGVSLVAFVLAQAALAIAYGVFTWPVLPSVLFSLVASAVPAYVLNRLVVWPDRGDPEANIGEGGWFMLIALCGSVATIALVSLAEHVARSVTLDHATLTLVVTVAGGVASVAIWLVRYVVLDRTIFRARRMTSDPIGGNGRLSCDH